MEKGRGRMAAQCRSPRCTAERKGFRRELDSWRHRLIHCVGFESILEGLYGPGLRRDLSLFDDCEPDELTDWCVDDRCSFCNLRKETVSECTPIYSSQSPPTDDQLPQGQFNTEKIECQAENYINALFRKKDLPQNCDPNIPLVAQELMKNMIRQFAIEYVSKSRKLTENKNGSSVDSIRTCNGVKMSQTQNSLQEEQDGPLDLTVTRTVEEITLRGDGVLDLSTKKTDFYSENSLLNSTFDTSVSRSYSCIGASRQKKATTLNKVLASLCKYHQQQILQMLKFLVHDENASALKKNCNKLHNHPRNQNSIHQIEAPLCSSIQHRHTRRCRFKNIKTNSTLKPLSICVRDVRLSCKTVDLGNLQTAVNQGVCHSSNLHNCGRGVVRKCLRAGRAFSSMVCDVSKNIRKCKRSVSSSPPQFSPMQTDPAENVQKAINGGTARETNRLKSNIKQSPALLEANHKHIGNVCKNGLSQHPKKQVIYQSSVHRETFDKSENTVLFQDLLDRINEKLNSIDTCNMETPINVLKLLNIKKPANDTRKFENYIKFLVHNAKSNDYNFLELLKQHEENIGSKTIETRFRKRQKALFADHESEHVSFPKYESFQVKSEYAHFGETLDSKSSLFEKRPSHCNKDDKTSRAEKSKDFHSRLLKSCLRDPKSNLKVPCQNKSVCLPSCELSKRSYFGDNFSSMPDLENSSGINTHRANCITIKKKSQAHNYLHHTGHENVNALKGNCNALLRRTKQNIVTNITNIKQNLESTKIEKDGKCNGYPNMDLNQIAKNTNVQVLVERLEDTITLANKSFIAGSVEKNRTEDVVKCKKRTSESQMKYGACEIPCKKKNLMQTFLSKHKTYNSEYTSSKYVETTDHKFTEGSLSSGPGMFTTNCEDLRMASRTWKDPTFSAYSSPIKLMFVSQVKRRGGVKFTLSSVDFASKRNGECCLFERSGECKAVITLKKGETTRGVTKQLSTEGNAIYSNATIAVKEEPQRCDDDLTAMTGAEYNPETKDSNKNEEQMDTLCNTENAAIKRKPGRPKKVGPKIVQHIKRPIGRPHKPKIVAAENTGNKSETKHNHYSDKCSAARNDSNNNTNITVTVVFGRSRRARRHVSQDKNKELCNMVLHPAKNPNEFKDLRHTTETEKMLHKESTVPDLVSEKAISVGACIRFRPIGESSALPDLRKNVQHPNKVSVMVIKKLGRPPKVKLSGISVTVNRVSSQKRTVSLNNCMSSKDHETVVEKEICKVNAKPCKKSARRDNVQRRSSRFVSNNANNVATTQQLMQLRQSVRTKIPSISFLAAVASSSAFTRKSASVRKPYRLELGKAVNCNTKVKSPVTNPGCEHTLEINQPSDPKASCVNGSYLSAFEVTSDSIFNSDNSLRWWTASDSKDNLLNELNSRFEQMTDTWLNLNANETKKPISVKREHTEQEYDSKLTGPVRNSILDLELTPVRMLFQKKCDLNEICSWFMQTTETRSLIMGKKELLPNPLEEVAERKNRKGAHKPHSNGKASGKHLKKSAPTSPTTSLKWKASCKVTPSHVPNEKNDVALVKLGTERRIENPKKKDWKQHHTQQTMSLKSKTKNPRHLCLSQKNLKENGSNSVPLIESRNILQVKTEIVDTSPGNTNQVYTSTFFKRNKVGQGLKQGLKQEEIHESVCKPKDVQDCGVLFRKLKHTKVKAPCEQDGVILPEVVVNTRKPQLHFSGNKRWALRSHSNNHHAENTSERAKHPNCESFGDSTNIHNQRTLSASHRVMPKSESRHMNNAEILKRNPKRKGCSSPLGPVDRKMTKRKKKQSRNRSCKITNNYSTFQLGPIIPVRLPMLRGFKSRNIEYSMTPFRMPLNGASSEYKK